jgi:hypothetical protein
VAAREMLQRRLDVGQQRGVMFDQVRADSLDFVAQMIATVGRKLGGGLMQRHHIRPPAVAMSFYQAKFGAAHGGMNVGALETEAGVGNGGGERVERLEEMDIRIPESVIGVENQIQRSNSRDNHLFIR